MRVENILDAIGSVLNLGKVFLRSKYSTLKLTREHNTLTILANGPSLSATLSENSAFEGDIMVVNSFFKTDKFTTLKPKYYIISAPEFWLPMKGEAYISMQQELEYSFANDVNWEMIFFIPYKSKKHNYGKRIESINPKIKTVYYNDTAIDSNTWIDRWLMNTKLAMPRPHNVLIPSLMISTWMGYSTINAYGADHSWLPSIYVDTNNNTFLTQKHFYDAKSAKAAPMLKDKEESRKLHEMLHKFYLSFKAYHVINSWSATKGTKIINKTKESFIDAFERK